MSKKTGTSGGGGSGPRASRRRRPRRHGRALALAGNPFAAVLGTVQKDIETRLEALFAEQLKISRPNGKEVVDLVAALRDLCLRGGKRLRPALVVAGYRAASERAPLEPALDAGVALELLQAYFLIHDDWMDQDLVRRGGPSVHSVLSKRYKSDHIGASSAILAGDFAVGLATAQMAKASLPASRVVRVMTEFANMQLSAVQGQQRDILGATDVEHTYTLKTSSYTVRGPLVLGALLAGGSVPTCQTLEQVAQPLGIAFQLRDDLMGTFGDPAKTGKPVAGDLREGKRTVLLQQGLKRARGRDHRLLTGVVGNPKASESQLARAVDVLERVGAKKRVEERIEELLEESRLALENGRATRSGRELLEGAITLLGARRT